MTDGPELLDALVSHPDDLERHQVYADWLSARGDPRGELITIQAQLERDGPEPGLAARALELITRLEADLFEADERDHVTLEWRLGFVRSVQVVPLGMAALTQKLQNAPSLSLVRSLSLRTERRPLVTLEAEVQAILGAPAAATIEHLALGTPVATTPPPALLAALAEGLPRLKDFELSANALPDLDVLAPFTRLERLALWVMGLTTQQIDQLIRAPLWATLKSLLVSLRQNVRVSSTPDLMQALAPVLDGFVLPQLEHLALMNAHAFTGFEDALIADLPARALVKRLRSLGLTWNRTTGEPALSKASAALKHVRLVWPRPPGAVLSADDHYHLGVLLRTCVDQPAEALPHYQQACAGAPNDVMHWFALGNAFGDLRRRDEQFEAYTRALAVDPQHTRTLQWQGRALCKVGRFDDALRSFTRAIETAPTLASPLNDLGSLHQRRGEVDDAVAAFERAVSLDPKHEAGRNLVDVLLEHGRPAEARQVLDALLAQEPDDAQLLRKLGRVHLASGADLDALAIADAQLQPSPRHFARYLRVAALTALGRAQEACVTCDEIIAVTRCPTSIGVGWLARALAGDLAALGLLDVDDELSPAAVSNGLAARGTAARSGPVVAASEEDDPVNCALLSLAASLLRGNLEVAQRRRTALATFLDSQEQGYATDPRWDHREVLLRAAKAVDAASAQLLHTCLAVATGRRARTALSTDA